MHRNAPLTPEGRLRLCRRIEAGWPVAQAACSMGISRDRAYVWWHRYQEEGIAGLQDRSSRPHHSPCRVKRRLERRVVSLRVKRGLGPARIGGIVGLHASTTHRVLVRYGLNRLDHLDRITRAPIRRFETSRPGELVHVDVKKLGRVPPGGGWRAHGRSKEHHGGKDRVGYAYIHSAIDGYSRLAYSEVLTDEQGLTLPGSGSGQRGFSPIRESSSSACSATTVAAIAHGSSHAPSEKQRTASLGLIVRRPTEKSNDSIGRWWPSGATPGPGPERPSASGDLPAGYTSTTITATTPRSGVHRSVVSGTSQVTTTRPWGPATGPARPHGPLR